ncbi:MAG: hypothetical protein K6T83_02590 [Alicyclobacillus sp.]|nr:hypothetical protein [Alicyclobacillus sp.]
MTLNDESVKHLLLSDSYPIVPDRLDISMIRREIRVRQIRHPKVLGRTAASLGIALAILAVGCVITLTSESVNNVVFATMTPLGRLVVLKHSEAEQEAKGMNLEIATATEPPKVSAQDIIQSLVSHHYFGTQHATSIEAVHCKVSGIPRIMANPCITQRDKTITVTGDYLNGVSAWIITFSGMNPGVQGGVHIKISSPPRSYNTIFDANTGDPIIGFTGR